jgi:hypothetical protein
MPYKNPHSIEARAEKRKLECLLEAYTYLKSMEKRVR